MANKFVIGDRVVWSHVVAPEQGAGSIVKASMVYNRDPQAQLGSVIGYANDVATWVEVQFDGSDATRVLVESELVKVEE